MLALKAVRIVELAEGVAGEYCAKLLSDFGAEVIKIEPPGGSAVRAFPPFGIQGPGTNNSALFTYLNTNKRSVVLDLETEAGVRTLSQLLKLADVVIDDHAPGWLADVGLDPAQIGLARPDLILCAITPYGQTAPKAAAPAEDLTIFHASGWGYHTPSGADAHKPPLKGAGRFAVSYEAALDAALCVAAALYERHETGRGRVIDISKQRVMASRLDYVLAQMLVGEMDVTEARTAFDLGGPASILPCQDGHVYVWMSDAKMWWAMHDLMGKPAWMLEFPEDWLQKGCTPERVAICRAHLTKWLKTQTKHEFAAAAQMRGVMVVALNNAPDLLESPQYKFREFFTDVEHPELGRVTHPTVPYKLSVSPASITSPAPLLGQHTQEMVGAISGGANQSAAAPS